MGIRRIGKHLFTSRGKVYRAFPPAAFDRIERAIKDSETRHGGQIRFVVEGALDNAPLFRDQPARERALDIFSQLRIWDTEHNNGVLIYLLLADRDVEIIADRGIHARVDEGTWDSICREMEGAFREGRYEAGVLRGIELITAHLVEHFPKDSTGTNELPDAPVVV
ncbi:TPM domain-containing protein [Rhodopseudomonas telluris]|uniref:TPM domain-containing protein n=1 Tax=Rhodopseudomonas telluris TaxID=644215 RepID=A0ABV6EU85_9BRAD